MSIADIKAGLPIDYVLHDLGFEPVRAESAAILYHVPWRADTQASLALFPTDGSTTFDRWADRAGQDGGDVLDLIQRLYEYDSVGPAMHKGEELLASLAYADYAGPQVPDRVTLSSHEMEDHVNRSRIAADAGSTTQFQRWLTERGADYTADWLAETFHTTAEADRVTMPFLDRDGAFELYRYRPYADGAKPMSPAGAKMTLAYGLHIVDPDKDTVIVEGESDTWHGTWHLGDQYNFVGVPGASIHPSSLDIGLSDGQTVYLAFDGDRAGRDAAKKWAEFLLSTGVQVRIVPMPAGKDLSDIRRPEVLFRNTRQFDPVLHGIGYSPARDSYVKLTKDGDPGLVLSDFVIEVDRTIETTDGRLYEVIIGATRHIIRPWDLMSAKAFRAWALTRNLLWTGNDRELSLLISLLKADSVFLPAIEGVSVAGLHDGTFVWPGGVRGDRDLRYVEGIVEGFEERDFSMSPSPTPRHASEAVLGFLELYPASVTTPILAWLAAAPLRSQASTFPYLAISGEYGTGKSAFLEKYIPAITGFSRTLGLGADPTLYAMTSLMAAGNAFPVMLDEFRTNHSKRNAETLAAVSNVIRASWNAGVRETGGHPLDPKRKIRSAMSSPLIVAGEIEQDEGSTRERMVPVYLVKAEQGDEGRIMDALVDPSSFAPMYLDFLLHSPIDGEAAHLREVYGGPAHLDNRMRITLGYLEQGWALLQDFMAAIGRPIDAVDLDLSAVLGAFEETKAEPPLSVALMEVMGSTHGMNPAVWEEDEVVYVKMGQFAKEAEGLGYIVGPPKTVGKSLDTLFQAGSARITVDGRKVRVRTIPAEKLSGTMEA